MKIERWGWYSIGVHMVLMLLNLAIARASGSLAVTAEMVNNGVDLFSSVAVLVGLKLSSRKTKAFPYGMYKLENMVAVALALMIGLSAYEIAKVALFAPARDTIINSWTLVGVALSAVIPFIFGHYELRAGRRANSPALIAEARDYQLHLISSGMVFVALVGQLMGFRLDRVVALAIVVLAAKTGWSLLSEAMRVLLDASLDAETLQQVRDIIEAEPSVTEVGWVTGRNAGRFRFIEAAIKLRLHDLDKALAASQHIESRIREAVPHVDRVLIHAEPLERTHLRCAVPLADLRGTISEHFGEAPYFAVARVRLSDGHIEEHQGLGNPFVDEPKAKGIAVAEWLVAKKVDIVLLRQSLQGRGPTYVFREAGVEMELTQAETLLEGLGALT